MMYTIEQLELDIDRITTHLQHIRKAKGHDYSTGGDTLENLRHFGWKGVMVRLFDKLQRLKSFSEKESFMVKDESLYDTFMDIINYAYYLPILYDQDKQKPRAYYSASMRGEDGDRATDATLDLNREIALTRSQVLRDNNRGVSIFVPHQYENKMRPAWKENGADFLIEIDKVIIDGADIVIIDSDPAYSEGVCAEERHAVGLNKKIIYTYDTPLDKLKEVRL